MYVYARKSCEFVESVWICESVRFYVVVKGSKTWKIPGRLELNPEIEGLYIDHGIRRVRIYFRHQDNGNAVRR